MLLLCAGTAAAGEPPLRQFVSAAGRFSILMPGKPVSETQPLPLKSGQTMTLYQFFVEREDNNVSYAVVYGDYPPNAANGSPRALLEGWRDGSVASAGAGAKLLSDRVLDLNGVPGRAFAVLDKDGSRYDVHDFYVNFRLYQVIVVTNKGHVAPDREAFMNSFKIQ